MSTWWRSEDVSIDTQNIADLADEWLQGPGPLRLEDLVTIGDSSWVIGVPYWSDEEFKRYVLAGVKAYATSSRSIDRILRDYGPAWTFSEKDQLQEELFLATSDVRSIVTDSLNTLFDSTPAEVPLGRFAAEAALLRLQNTFQAVVLLVRQGLHFEVQTLSRLILEQLAWAHAVSGYEDASYTDLRAERCISGLKQMLPNMGRMYGELSKTTHMRFETTLRYVKSDGRQMIVTHRATDVALVDAYHLLVLADAFRVECDHIRTNDGLRGQSFMKGQPNSWELAPDRPTLLTVKRHEAIIDGLLSAVAEAQGESPAAGTQG